MTAFKIKSKGPSQRQLKVGEQVRHILSDILARFDFHDETLAKAHVHLSEIRMSPDLRNGKAYITSLMGENLESCIKALNDNEFYIRKLLAKEMTMKFLPKIRFYVDDAYIEANKIEALFQSNQVSQDLEKK